MKRVGTISYNIYCNFTNYGSALQTWALHQAIKKVGKEQFEPVLIDYCPNCLMDKDPLNPFANMWDKDEESKRMCELTMPAIKINYQKFDRFYHERFVRTKIKYTASNFNDVVENENIDAFVCGSDTIFCIDEFDGFDDGYYANFDVMKNGYSVAYAASFGDAHFDKNTLEILKERLYNFKYIGLRENTLLDFVKENVTVPTQRVIDPTLLLSSEEYECITEKRQDEKYLLLYARRYNPKMEAFAEKIAKEKGLKIIEISLRATNVEKYQMFYEAGVEEFLSLVKYADYVVTNSFHGAIFSIQFNRPFNVFSREQCDIKIEELLDLCGLKERLIFDEYNESNLNDIDYKNVHSHIEKARENSLQFLLRELQGIKK